MSMILHSDLLPTGRADADPWWMNAVLYQIYPRSFQDSDGDGVGDLQGIVRRLEYLAQLGVDIVWISPIYRSPQADNGYDISDYRDIDPLFGDLETFDALVARAHELGMHIVMDLVVNHTSVEHPWFVESATGPDSARRDWYYWRDPRPGAVPGTPGAEPSNWESFFGGSAWEYDPASGQYYLHLFAREQPDLNWENPEVRDAVYDMMNWWLDRGVDGFRVDAIDVISKRPGLPAGAAPPPPPESALLFCDPDRREFNMLIQFEHVNLGQENGKFSPRTLADGELADVMSTWQKTLGERGWNALYLENHDQPRAVSRFGDPHGAWYESATALATAYFLQRGTPFIYQGQEIGMLGGHFTRPSDFRDIESLNYLSAHPGEGVSAGLAAISRDNGRTPMQWDSSPAAGFTSGTPWIDLPPSASSIHVERQLADASSVLAFYRALIDARHRVPALTSGSFRRVDAGDPGLFVYVRSSEGSEVLVMTNLTGRAITPRGVFLDEDLSPSRWDLYLGNVASPTDSSEAEAGDPLPSSTMAPWEARVYLR